MYRHTFRVFRDKDSGCVRFEATARRGPLKSVPIWTAFVTQYIGHRGWMRRVGAATIQFRELHPYVFCDGYKLPKGPTHKYQLTFSQPEGRHMLFRIHDQDADHIQMHETSWTCSIPSEDRWPVPDQALDQLDAGKANTPKLHDARPHD